jgi:hypothetical protein
MTMLRNVNGGVLLCCGKAKCPLVNLEGENQLTITDDDGNKVKLDIDQARLLTQAIDQLKDKK